MTKHRRMPALALLGERDFLILWISKSIHEMSRRMELLVLGYLILQLTGSAFHVGLVSVFLNGPRPVLSLFAGHIADRFNRRLILIVVHSAYLISAISILLTIVTGTIGHWFIFGTILFQGIAKVMDDPSRRTAILDLSGEVRLANAMSLETINNNAGKIIGPLLGGVLIAVTGFIGAYAFIAILDIIALVLMIKLRLPTRSKDERLTLPIRESLVQGIKYSVKNRTVLGVLIVSLVMNGLVFPIQYFIPVIASDVLSVSTVLGGILGSADGIGNLIGASMIAMKRNISRHGLLFVGGAMIIAVAVTLVAWSPWFLISFILLLIGGWGQAGFSTMQATIVLLASHQELRGRTQGAQGLVNGLGHLIGGYEIGAIASAFGITLAIGLNAAAGIILLIALAIITPLVKQRGTPHP